MKKRSELLLPAGNLSKLKTAMLYGADAVYAGTPSMSLRTKSGFGVDDLKTGAKLLKQNGKKLYLTLNLFAHNKDTSKLPEFVKSINEINPDGVIVADPGIFSYLKKHVKSELHISTQANVCSSMAVNFWKDQGADLCVLAREVPFNEIKEIKENCKDIKIEAFIHGAMCMTYSGRCLLSNFMAERGANQGSCAHSCRWNYKLKCKINEERLFEIGLTDENKELFDFVLEEEFRKDEYYTIEEDELGSYILNSKDLCLMPVLDDYLKIGVDSLKIEGRNKSDYYVAITSRAYRMAIDSYYKDPENFNYQNHLDELYTLQNRGYTMGFHKGRVSDLAFNYNRTRSLSDYLYCGMIKEQFKDYFIIEVKNQIKKGDILEIVPAFSIEPIRFRINELYDPEGTELLQASPGVKNNFIKVNFSTFHNESQDVIRHITKPMTIIRKEVSNNDFFANHLKIDKTSFKVEQEKASQSVLDSLKNKSGSLKDLNSRGPKLGDASCCSRGCNGCLPFWNEDKYKTLREKLINNKNEQRLPKALINL